MNGRIARVLRRWNIAAWTLALVACGGGGHDEPPPPTPLTLSVSATLATQAEVEGTEVDGLWFEFNQPVRDELVNAGTIKVRGPLGDVPGTYEVSSNGLAVRFRSAWPMYVGEEYRSTVSGVKGRQGETLPAEAMAALRVPSRPMAAGSHVHVCALRGDGRVVCWGRGSDGELGSGSTDSRGDAPGSMGTALEPVDLGRDATGEEVLALEIATTSGSTCARLVGGRVKCWGSNAFGQLGVGLPESASVGGTPAEMGDALPAVNLGTDRRALQLAGGHAHLCALLDDGSVKCWGKNNAGQLGQGDTQPRGTQLSDMGDALPAIDLGSGRRAVQISAGTSFTCSALDNATLKCWGGNSNGQLGLGQPGNRGHVPGSMGDALPAVDLGASVIRVSAGDTHACALLQSDALKCWGRNEWGQLGLGDAVSRGLSAQDMGQALLAVDLGSGRRALAVRAGIRVTCVLLDTGSPACWGLGANGVNGLDSSAPRGMVPSDMGEGLATVLLPSGAGFVEIGTSASNWFGVCAWRVTQELWCWGDNSYGRLGQGYMDPSSRGGNPGDMAALEPVDLGPQQP